MSKVQPTELKKTEILDRSADAGLGFENFNTNKDLKIPFLNIIQGLSPELKKDKPQYIRGAEQGDIFNSVTRKLYKVNEPDGKPIRFVPITHVRVHNEWVKRANNGGYVKTYPDGLEPKTEEGFDGQKKVKQVIGNKDHCLVETVMHDVYVLDEEEGTYEAIISMAGSNLGPSRDFTSKLRARKETNAKGEKYTPPYFDNIVELSTVLKPFADGECYVFRTQLVGRTLEADYSSVKELHNQSKDRLALMAPAAAIASLEDRETPSNTDSPY